jgi:hypothetical protein
MLSSGWCSTRRPRLKKWRAWRKQRGCWLTDFQVWSSFLSATRRDHDLTYTSFQPSRSTIISPLNPSTPHPQAYGKSIGSGLAERGNCQILPHPVRLELQERWCWRRVHTLVVIQQSFAKHPWLGTELSQGSFTPTTLPTSIVCNSPSQSMHVREHLRRQIREKRGVFNNDVRQGQ